jgi:hypothetical protein
VGWIKQECLIKYLEVNINERRKMGIPVLRRLEDGRELFNAAECKEMEAKGK